MVELDDIRVGNYFQVQDGLFEVREDDYTFLHELHKFLIPLKINKQRLSRLGFSSVPGSGLNKWERASSYGKQLFLKALTDNKWVIQFASDEKVRIVEYIHELQNVYYWLFAEPLQRPKEKETGTLRPSHRIVQDYTIGSKRPQNVPAKIQPFYLSWDCLFLMSIDPYIIWQIVEDNYAFEYGGKKWGLKLKLGEATNLHDDRAISWLKHYVQQYIGANRM